MLGVMSANMSPPRSFRHDDLVIPRMQRKTVVTLLPGDCRWPIGAPRHRLEKRRLRRRRKSLIAIAAKIAGPHLFLPFGDELIGTLLYLFGG